MNQPPTYLPTNLPWLKGLALEALPKEATPSVASARAYCKRLATGRYENFSVASFFLPKPLRQHFFNVYAYCRWSDDLADETGDTGVSTDLLNWWEEELRFCYAGTPRHPVFVALEETIHQFDIPMTPFQDLLTAFRQDQRISRYATYDELMAYCRYSANPVGRLVLYLCGYRDEQRQLLSDATCSALQLTNFWQDVTVDLEKGRIYLPLEDLRRFGYTEEELCNRIVNDRFITLMRFEVERARELFQTGLQLCEQLDRRVRLDIELFNRGGLAILDQIKAQGYDTLTRRPSLSKARKMGLILRYAGKRLTTDRRLGIWNLG